MRVKKYLALTLAAILATTMLTACPWDQEEDETDDASSVPVTSTDTSTSQDDDDHDSGDDDGQPTKPSLLWVAEKAIQYLSMRTENKLAHIPLNLNSKATARSQ